MINKLEAEVDQANVGTKQHIQSEQMIDTANTATQTDRVGLIFKHIHLHERKKLTEKIQIFGQSNRCAHYR